MDSSPQIYTRYMHPPLLELAEWLKEKQTPVTLLDIGCGDGLKIGGLIDLGYFSASDRIIGLDINSARIERLKERYPAVEGRVGNAATLAGIEDDSCDGAIASAVVEHLDDPALFLKNTNRILRRDGRAYISSLVRRKHVVYLYRNAKGEFSRDPEHVYEWRSDAEFLKAVSSHLKVVKFRRSPFEVTLGCAPLLLRRLGILGDAIAARVSAKMDAVLPWLSFPDPFFHRVEVIVEKAP